MKLTKFLALLLAVLMVVAVFAACNNAPSTPSGEDSKPPEDSSEPTDDTGDEEDPEPTEEEVSVSKLNLYPDKATVTHWTGYSGTDRPYMEKIMGDFNDNDEIGQLEVSIMSWTILNQKMGTAYASDTGPDTICGGARGVYYQGAQCDLSPAYDDGRMDLSIFTESLQNDIAWDGGVWATPMCLIGYGLYYNVDKLTEIGVTEIPDNLDDLVALGKQLTKIGDNGEVEQYGLSISYDLFYTNFLWDAGFEVLDLEQDGKAIINEPGVAEVLEKVSGYVRDDKISPLIIDNMNMMISGKLAMYSAGPWETTGLTDGGVNFDIAPLPGESWGHSNSFVPTKWLLTGDERKFDAFINFSNHWLDKDNQLYWCNGSGYPLMRVDQNYTDLDPERWAYKYTSCMENLRSKTYSLVPGLANVDGDTGILRNLWEQAIYGQITDYQAALDQAAADIDVEVEAVDFKYGG